MIRRLLIPLLGSGLLLAASAGSAFAKCEETVDPKPAPPVAPVAPVLPIGLALAGLAAAALAGQVIRDRSKRRTAGAGAAVSASDHA